MQIAFDTLKGRLTSPPVLAFPDFDEQFVVETDASATAVGPVLAQRSEDGMTHPIQFASRSLEKAERNYAVCEHEASAVIFALKKFRVYLLGGKPFRLITDHQALQYAFKKKDVHGRLARWLDLLAEYEFEVEYLRGSENGAADYLSRSDATAPVEGTSKVVGTVVCPEKYSGLEDELQALAAYLSGKPFDFSDFYKRRGMKLRDKHFLVWGGRLFRRTKAVPKVVPSVSGHEAIVPMPNLVVECSTTRLGIGTFALRFNLSRISSGGLRFIVRFSSVYEAAKGARWQRVPDGKSYTSVSDNPKDAFDGSVRCLLRRLRRASPENQIW